MILPSFYVLEIDKHWSTVPQKIKFSVFKSGPTCTRLLHIYIYLCICTCVNISNEA